MTNKEKYKQAFSTMHISDEFSLEVKKMTTTNNKPKLNRLVASIAACVLIVGSATAAYATDFCGIQRTIQLWIHGDQTNVTIQFDGNGNYNMDYIDDEGHSKNHGGGGMAIEDDGSERPLTEDELLELITAPDVNYEDNGSVWVYWFDKKIDITDKFENNVCYIKLVNGEETLYMTVKYQNGYATSPDSYPVPSSFN
ncbi:hypothetical protein [Anaerotignum sp.]|uniref:hypothetical protein n=1 Tax=Anaerotignum sp. TaxID=2039241 RepID=UPI00289AB81B|nr:hypothetical protein [Anaerotignum sp.]